MNIFLKKNLLSKLLIGIIILNNFQLICMQTIEQIQFLRIIKDNQIVAEELNENFGTKYEYQLLQQNIITKTSEPIQTDDEIVIQRRMDGSVNFYRTWPEYTKGFGTKAGEFFIGLDQLHKITNSRSYQLIISMGDWDNGKSVANYDKFVIGSAEEKYALKSLGNYTGTAGDSLTIHLNMKFSTKDQDNDTWDEGNCAKDYEGAWWYLDCCHSNLNGPYKKGSIPFDDWGKAVYWDSYKGPQYSLKFVEMKLHAN